MEKENEENKADKEEKNRRKTKKKEWRGMVKGKRNDKVGKRIKD